MESPAAYRLTITICPINATGDRIGTAGVAELELSRAELLTELSADPPGHGLQTFARRYLIPQVAAAWAYMPDAKMN